jgi:hypothetical protein
MSQQLLPACAREKRTSSLGKYDNIRQLEPAAGAAFWKTSVTVPLSLRMKSPSELHHAFDWINSDGNTFCPLFSIFCHVSQIGKRDFFGEIGSRKSASCVCYAICISRRSVWFG